MTKTPNVLALFLIFNFSFLIFIGCSSSEPDKKENEEVNKENESSHASIINVGFEEQKNPMYSRSSDSSILYNTGKLHSGLSGYTKCNIFALNVIYKSGYKCPDEYLLCKDFFDTTRYGEFFPFVRLSSLLEIQAADLIVWRGHIIICEKPCDEEYVFAIWGGSSREDDGTTIINGVKYGKYKITGDYIIRRPIKKE
jgi:hypothetical protein